MAAGYNGYENCIQVLIAVIPPSGNEKNIFTFKNIFIQGEILYFSSSISTGIKS